MRLGLWSLAHLHAYSYIAALSARDDIEFVGITDQDVELGTRTSKAHHTVYYDEADALLERIDAVVITSANADHCTMALRAAEAGVSALVEKPLATTMADGERMIAAFRKAGLVLATAFPCPFSPPFVELQRTLSSGQVGRPLALKTTNRGSMPGGFFIELERSGGGAVIDHTVHVADLLRRLMGAEPVQVSAEIGHGLYHQTWDDSGILTLDWADGTFATLDCSWSRPKAYPTWGDVTLKVVAERGNVSADLFGQHITHYGTTETPPVWRPWGTDTDRAMIDDFITAVRRERVPMSSGEDGLAALKVALAAYRSAHASQPVRIGDLV